MNNEASEISKEVEHNKGSDRRKQILQIALERFARQGYHHTKISDIVSEAGVAQGTFYWYFKSKEAIALEIIREGQEQLLEVIGQGYRQSYATVKEMEQASEALFIRLFLFADHNRYLMELLLSGTGANGVISGAIHETKAAMERAFRRNIQRAIELEMLSSTIDAELRAAMLMSLVEGVISRWLFIPSEPDSNFSSRTIEELAAETAKFEFFGLLGK
ncbi:TetR/AcrR family transcriptional regulator [Paenibacillus sp. IHBB 10380]|uniref:TetR/AcrR family transcriptional regulator n=1 Tax=Paenibacillus sp. IHBB 10380 TaxID=1566358 RepID=UPI0005CFA4F9|nr:TetR/AcrR family transcriptional regulator [Paenibacillus sp. IHBB 10380]AJS60056.1 TetR family transcriptional regulator [Paenibacillus sp. IHBB 10380]